jgi:mxaC protein
MTLAVDHPWLLALLVLAMPALFGRDTVWQAVPSLAAAPFDRVAAWLDALLRVLAGCAIASIVLGLAGLHGGQRSVARSGNGAHIILVLDRSLSMDEPFALQGHKATESKTQAAARLLEDFFARRPSDSFGIAAFSTAPMQVLPLTAHRDAVAAALRAMRQKALANTDIGGGLVTALHMFAHDNEDATRVILLVSDGAGFITDALQDEIRAEVLRQHVHVYYLYLRAGDEPPLLEDMGTHTDSTHPAALDAFLHGLGVPYRGFEASDPASIVAATDAIGQLETRPLTYQETLARIDYDRTCYAIACLCLALILLARLAEREFVPKVGWGVARPPTSI